MSLTARLTGCRAVAVAAAAAMALSACSSTKDLEPAAPDDAVAVDSGGAPASEVPAPVPTGADGEPLTKAEIVQAVKEGKLPQSALVAASAAPAGSGDGDSTAAAPKSGSSAAAAKPAAPKPAAAPGSVGPGVTAKEIKIGIGTFKVGNFAKQFGIDADPGDNEAQAKAVLAYVNSHGGMAGRKAVPVFYTVDFTNSKAQDGQFEAEACEKWTEDDKVFAVVNPSLNRTQLLPCLAKKDVLGVHVGLQITEARMSPYRRWYYSTMAGSGVIQDRAARTETAMLCAKGWFKDTTVGLIYFDDPNLKAVVDKDYVPAMKKCGMKKFVPQAAPRGATTPDSAYVARFQSEGVTNVMFLGEGGGYPLTFMSAAESQRYRPKYALRSDHAPALTLQGVVPDAQLNNAIGFGWSPANDVDGANDPGPTNEADKLCRDIYKKAGIDLSNRGAALASMTYCSGLLFLQQTLAKASGVNSAAFEQAANGLGRSFVPPATFTCLFGARQHDCPSSYRELVFKDKAFRYSSGLKPMTS